MIVVAGMMRKQTWRCLREIEDSDCRSFLHDFAMGLHSLTVSYHSAIDLQPNVNCVHATVRP